LERARKLAEASHCSLDEILEQALDQMEHPTPSSQALLGLFADEPAIADKLMEDVYRSRELGVLRLPNQG
jgi:hypothetical protein